MSQVILVETREKVGLIRINRPAVHNALNDEVMDSLGEALDEFEADENIGCVVLTGSDKAFAARRRHCGHQIHGLHGRLQRRLHHAKLGAAEDLSQTGHRRRGGLRARRRVRARHDVRHGVRGGQRKVWAAGSEDWRHPRRGRNAAPAARGGQVQGDGSVPDGPPDGRAGSGAVRIGGAHLSRRQAAGGGFGRGSRHRRLLVARRHDDKGSGRIGPSRALSTRACCSSVGRSTRRSAWRTRKKGWRRSSRSGSRNSGTDSGSIR